MPETFTQGLLFDQDRLLESSGLYGKSYLVELNSESLQPIRQRYLPASIFAEGIAIHQGELFLLTWREQKALVFDPNTFELLREIPITGEGWGLTSDGERLWLSNGSDQLTVIHPQTGAVLSTLQVRLNDQAVNQLNELEWIDGALFANRWYDNTIYKIDPSSGMVEGVLNLESLARQHNGSQMDNVLNGIAWHQESATLWVTGKHWDTLYVLRLIEAQK